MLDQYHSYALNRTYQTSDNINEICACYHNIHGLYNHKFKVLQYDVVLNQISQINKIHIAFITEILSKDPSKGTVR